MATTEVKFGPVIGASATMGAGVGGILDITVFHQIFQSHQSLSNKIGNETIEQIRSNLLWDGYFQLLSLILIFVGTLALWKACENPYSPRSSKTFYGGILLGWGVFITMEGIINHILLELHHVIENINDDHMLIWDVLYILLGVSIGWAGKILIGQGKTKFYNHQMRQARHRSFRFRPAFNRKSHQVKVQEDILPSIHASNNLH